MIKRKSDVRIPSLDGFRAIAIAMVMICHFFPRTREVSHLNFLIERSSFGVEVFFVVSGYLITYLLLNEELMHKSISLYRFYMRRVLRIVPPLYAYLLTLIVLSSFTQVVTPLQDILYSAVFVRNYLGESAQTAHCWSLSVEEHYYLLWPAILVVLRTSAARLIFCFFVIVATPIWSHFVYEWAGGAEFVNNWRTDLRMMGIAMGSGLACLRIIPTGERVLSSRFFVSSPTLVVSLTVVVLSVYTNLLSAPIIRALNSMIALTGVTMVLNAAIRSESKWWVRLLDATPISYFGKMSYGVYLWQQLWMPAVDDFSISILDRLCRVAGALLCGLVSFYVVDAHFAPLRSIFRRD